MRCGSVRRPLVVCALALIARTAAPSGVWGAGCGERDAMTRVKMKKLGTKRAEFDDDGGPAESFNNWTAAWPHGSASRPG